MCGVNSVITANEIAVCGYDSAVYDEVGNSNGVEVVVSIDLSHTRGAPLSNARENEDVWDTSA